MLGEGIDVHLLRVSLILPTPDLGSGISYVHRCGEGGQHPCPGFLWVERKGLEEEDLGWGGSVETLGRFWSQEGNECVKGFSASWEGDQGSGGEPSSLSSSQPPVLMLSSCCYVSGLHIKIF